MASPGLSMRSLWESTLRPMPHSRSMSCPPNYLWRAGLAKYSSMKRGRGDMGLFILVVTLRAGTAWILPMVLVKDWGWLFAQLALPLVCNVWGTEKILVLSATVTITLKSIFLFLPESYGAMLHFQSCHLAASLFWDHLVSDVKQLSRLSIKGGGHRGQGVGSTSQTWNRSTAPHSYKWKAAEHPSNGTLKLPLAPAKQHCHGLHKVACQSSPVSVSIICMASIVVVTEKPHELSCVSLYSS